MSQRVLIIDDDEALGPAIAEFFAQHGYKVQCATEAEEAIAMIRHHKFQLAITDLALNSIEGLDGFSVLKALRQSSPSTKVIVYSGHSDAATAAAALLQGASNFYAKPVPLGDLLACAEDICQPPS